MEGVPNDVERKNQGKTPRQTPGFLKCTLDRKI